MAAPGAVGLTSVAVSADSVVDAVAAVLSLLRGCESVVWLLLLVACNRIDITAAAVPSTSAIPVARCSTFISSQSQKFKSAEVKMMASDLALSKPRP